MYNFLRHPYFIYLLEAHRDALRALVEQNYTVFEELGTGDFVAKKREFQADANVAYSRFFDVLCRVAMVQEDELQVMKRIDPPFIISVAIK